MDHSTDRDFLFCAMCGTTLVFRSTKYAECPLCNFKRSRKDIIERKITYRVTAQDFKQLEATLDPTESYPTEKSKEDIRRELGITTYDEGKLQLATIARRCEKCGNNEFEYSRRQMRSADEGQTTFLTCTKCRDTVTEN